MRRLLGRQIDKILLFDKPGTVLAWAGQGGGTIKKGMGKELYDNNVVARAVMDCADKALAGRLPGNHTLSQHCFEDPMEILQIDTLISQLASYVVNVMSLVSYVEIRRWKPKKIFKFPRSKKPSAVTGMSVGLYAACYAAGMYNFFVGLEMVYARGFYMRREGGKRQNQGRVLVVKIRPGDYKAVKELCEETATARITNYNTPEQIIIGGNFKDMDAFEATAEERKLLLAKTKLAIGVVVHHPFMRKAAEDFSWAVLNPFVRGRIPFLRAKLRSPIIPVFVDSSEDEMSHEMTTVQEAVILLPQQIDNPVFWVNVMNRINSRGDKLIELGPSTVITKLNKNAKSVKRIGFWKEFGLYAKERWKKFRATLHLTWFLGSSFSGRKHRFKMKH